MLLKEARVVSPSSTNEDEWHSAPSSASSRPMPHFQQLLTNLQVRLDFFHILRFSVCINVYLHQTQSHV